MQIQLGTIRKRVNSTKNDANFSTFNGTLKENCSIIDPVIEFNFGNASPTGYNYMYIPDFRRFYFLTWEFRGSAHWYARGKVDVLASAKGEIGTASKYVLRSSAEEDENIIDTKYPATVEGDYDYATAALTGFADDPQAGGAYVIGVAGGNTGSAGETGITYYALTPSAMHSVMMYMFNDNDMPNNSDWHDFKWYIDFTSTSQNLPWKLLVNPLQYITSAIWLPFTISSGYLGSVKFAWFNSGIGGLIPNQVNRQLNYFCDCSNLMAPSATRKKWEFYEPWSSYFVNVPFFGIQHIKANDIFGGTGTAGVGITYRVDIRTGAAFAEVTGKQGICCKLAGQIGIPIGLSGAKKDYGAMISGAAQTAGGIISTTALAASGNPQAILSGFETIRNGVSTALSVAQPIVSTSGSAGSCAGLGDAIYVLRKSLKPTEKNNDEFGAPLCKVKTLASIPGFIQCSDGDLESSLSADEQLEIARYLTEGFFYE